MRFLLPLLIVPVCCCSCFTDPEIPGMRKGPVIVQTPQIVTNTTIPDSAFLVILSESSIDVNYDGQIFKLNSIAQLDSLIVKQDIDSRKRVALKADSTGYKRVDSAVQLLKKHNITRFNLITDLNDHP